MNNDKKDIIKDNGEKLVWHNAGYMEEREKEIIVALETTFVFFVLSLFLIPPFTYYIIVPVYNFLTK